MTSVTQPERGRGTILPLIAAAAALIALLVFAPFASAASDPLASGTTTLKLNKGFFKKLKKNDVKVLKVSPATVKSRTVTLPVNSTGSALDPTTGQGTISQSGGIKFKRQKKSVVLKNLVIDTTKKSLSGKIGNKSMKIASVAGLSFTRNGFGTNISIGKLKLTGKAAKQLNQKLGFSGKNEKPLFKANQVIGSSSSATQPSTVTVLPSGNASLLPNAGTLGKFATKKVNPLTDITPIQGAGFGPGPSFTFPITGGTIGPSGAAGTVTTSGGLQIAPAKGANTQFVNLDADFLAKTTSAEINIQPSPPAPGNLGRSSIADLDMTGATITSDPTARTVTISGAVARLQAVSAATLNQVYPGGVDFVAGDPLGTVSLTVHTQ